MTVPLAPSLVLEPEEGEDQAALLLIPTVQPGAPTEQGMLRVHRRGGASAVGPQDVPSSFQGSQALGRVQGRSAAVRGPETAAGE